MVVKLGTKLTVLMYIHTSWFNKNYLFCCLKMFMNFKYKQNGVNIDFFSKLSIHFV